MRSVTTSVLYGTIAAFIVYGLQAIVPSLSLATTIFNAGQFAIAVSLLLRSFADAFTIAITVSAILIGLNVALIAHYIKQRRAAPASGIAGGIAGMFAAVFGIGCAACGSTLAIALFGASSGGLVSMLPFGGVWLGDAGLAILIVSAVFTVRAIRKPLVCKI